jgi:hypothetical protein
METAIVRLASPEWNLLSDTVFSRYPHFEWATFARFGWRIAKTHLVLTLARIDSPVIGDLDEGVGHVAFAEPYSLRMALGAEQHGLAVGVIHSHPENCPPIASPIDDDMDSYYSSYFEGFAPGRPYVSLIASLVNGELSLSGRVYWDHRWLGVGRFSVEGNPSLTWLDGVPIGDRTSDTPERTARLSAAFGADATAKLRRSTVAVVGAGGTGSAAIEVLARAGVGRLIVVDPDRISESNLERVHGSCPRDVLLGRSKVSLAEEHVRSIDPSCMFEGYVASLPQDETVDALTTADVALGCTDQQHSRLALSDLAVRYLVPAIDCGVLLEGRDGRVTAEVVQLVRFLAADACALCRGMINPSHLAQEMMSESEKAERRAASLEASSRGERPDAYWHDRPQLNTVGSLTTIAGAMAAGYAVGCLTGRFEAPFGRLQMNLLAPYLDVTDQDQSPRADCVCRRIRGWADQARAEAFISPASHWPSAQRIGAPGNSIARSKSSPAPKVIGRNRF